MSAITMAHLLGEQRRPLLAEPFFAALRDLLGSIDPFHRHLSNAEEETLSRYCLVLSLWESLFRKNLQVDSPLYRLPRRASLADLLALPGTELVEDLSTLAADACADSEPLWPISATLNPVFIGSEAVGGGDADLLIGDCLFEVKTVEKWQAADLCAWLEQLLVYLLLDWSDAHQIRRLGLWLPRQRHLVAWPVEAWLFSPGELLLRSKQRRGFAPEEVLDRLTACRGQMQVVASTLDREVPVKSQDLIRPGKEAVWLRLPLLGQDPGGEPGQKTVRACVVRVGLLVPDKTDVGSLGVLLPRLALELPHVAAANLQEMEPLLGRPFVIINEDGKERQYRIPQELACWAAHAVGIQLAAGSLLPCHVEFGEVSGRPYAEFCIE